MYPATRSRLIRLLCCAALILFLAWKAQAQTQCQTSGSNVISCPNQIEGTLTLTSTNPAILSVLENAGPTRGGFSVRSVGTPTVLISTTSTPVAGPNGVPYEVTVQGGEPGSGIAHDVLAGLYRQAGSQSYYVFSPRRSDPVELEPAPDVHLDFQECAGLLEVRWVGDDGSPVAVQGGRIEAVHPTDTWINNPPGFGASQAGLRIPAGSTGEMLPVRGDGSTYRVRVFIDSGTDILSDKITIRHTADVQVTCDQVTQVTVPLGSSGLGRIVGQVDMLGETERYIRVRAGDGPFNNLRHDNPAAAGPFELENLVPSNLVSPPQGYQTYSRMMFFPDDRLEIFNTPYLEHSNRPLPVAGETVDLGDTFVIDPGYVSGAVEMHGPPSGLAGRSCVDTILQGGSTVTPQGEFLGLIVSGVEARGTSMVAPGATKPSITGSGRVAFKGAWSPDAQSLLADYRLALGGLHGESSIWNLQHFGVEYRLAGSIIQANLTDATLPPLEIVPGQEYERDFRYCFSEVNIGFRTTSGTFRSPGAGGSGSFAGTDFLGRPASYTVSTHGNGPNLPDFHTPSDRGRFTLCLPQATYTLTPTMNAINPNGTISQITLNPITFDAGCGQVIDLALGVQLSLDSLPQCSATAPRLAGSVRSNGPVDRIFARVNGGAETPICTDCGEDPAFDTTAQGAQCDSTIVVTAEGGGESSSATAFTRVDGTGPAFSGCQDIAVESEPGGQGATVFFGASTVDDCDGNLPPACDHPSGSFFAPGTTAVTCRAADRCGNESTCTFNVTVMNTPPPPPIDPDCSAAVASPGLLWPPNHGFVPIRISGVTSPDGGAVAISVTSIFQDEPVRGPGSGNTAPDGKGVGTATASVRSEREGGGDGRVYHITFTASNAEGGACTGTVKVGVPKSQGHGAPVDGGALYDSTQQ